MKINMSEEQIRESIMNRKQTQQVGEFFFDSGIEWNDPKVKEIEEKYGHNYWTGQATVAYAIAILLMAAQERNINFSDAERFAIDRAIYWMKEKRYLLQEAEKERQNRRNKMKEI